MGRHRCDKRERIDEDLWRWGAWAATSASALGYSPVSITATTGGRSGKVSDPTAKAADKMHWLHRLHSHIMQLERPWRRVVILRYIRGYDIGHIAGMMGLRYKRVQYRLQDVQDWLGERRYEKRNERGENAAILAKPEVRRLIQDLERERELELQACG